MRERTNASPWVLDVALVAFVLALTFVVHAPALDSAFARDDQLLLFDAANMPLLGYLFEMHGGHVMPVHKIVISAMYGSFGYQAKPFFVLALGTHLLNVALLYLALRRMVTAPLAAFGAALWGAAVVHQSSLCWFSVYGQILSVTCLLLVFVAWSRLGASQRPPTRAALLCWNLLLILAGTSFGVGIALSMAAPLLAAAFVGPSARRRAFLGLLPAAIVVPAVYGLVYRFSGTESTPLATPFLPEVTARLLFDLPRAGFASLVFGSAATQDAGRVLGGPLSGTPVDEAFPLLRAAGATVLLGIAAGLCIATPSLLRRAIGAALASMAVYALVAVARTQAVEVTSVAHFATEPRYHYTALVGAAMLVTFSLAAIWTPLAGGRLLGKSRLHAVLGTSLLLACLVLQAAPASRLSRTIQTNGFAHGEVALQTTLEALEAVVASVPPGGDLYLLNRDYEGTRWVFGLDEDPERFPGIAALFALTHDEDVVKGRRVRFVEDREDLLARIRAQPERRMARLLVSRAEANALGVSVHSVPPRRGQPTSSQRRPARGVRGRSSRSKSFARRPLSSAVV